MMMTHRIMLKTHPLFDDTRSLRPFDLIQERLANDEAPRRAPRRDFARASHQRLKETLSDRYDG
jgi:hypothetical protein